jgi:hypothetical protein
MDDRGSIPGRNRDSFLFATASRPTLGPIQPPIQRVPGTLFPEVKRRGREADHSPPSSVEVTNEWSYTSINPYVFMAWRNGFTFTSYAYGELFRVRVER